MSGRLELPTESSGLRYYLQGRPVHAGQGLELLTAPGTWAPGRYEWSYCREDRPLFHLGLGSGEDDGQCGPIAEMRLPPGPVLRWPE